MFVWYVVGMRQWVYLLENLQIELEDEEEFCIQNWSTYCVLEHIAITIEK